MFDMFGVSTQQLNEVTLHVSTQIAALGHLLMAKGVFTEEEWVKAIDVVRAPVEQAWQKKLEEARAEAEEESPGLAFFSKVFEGK